MPTMHAAPSAKCSLPSRAAGLLRARASVPASPSHEQRRVRLCASASQQGAPAALATSTQPPSVPEVDISALRSPAKIGCKSKSTIEVHDQGGDVSLATYMQLPVEQYFVLEPGMITSLGGNLFRFQVPSLKFFNLRIDPVVEVMVDLVDPEGPRPRVRLAATKCEIGGSPAIERMGLDRRFRMRMVTEMGWSEGVAGEDGGALGCIDGSSKLDVWCEVVPPFNAMPRRALESTCSAVLRATVGQMFPAFLRNLAADYRRWATDADYRAERARNTL
ncbi:unnamed protein product [Pedinophyceae sp. YPF-701]|nr:unnamed protein product [Pedinophyceae sp. YPF-701]